MQILYTVLILIFISYSGYSQNANTTKKATTVPVPQNKVVKNPEPIKPKSVDEFTVYSGFDFIPGEGVVFYDDFNQDSIGKFPSKWHANGKGKGELIKLSNAKWFKLINESVYIPEIATSLADVYTIQFDMQLHSKTPANYSAGTVVLSVLSYRGGNGLESDGVAGGKVEIKISPTGVSTFHAKNWYPDQKDSVDTRKYDEIFKDKLNKTIRVSLCVNKRRYKLYIDNKKIFDFGKFIPEDIMYDKFRITLKDFPASCEMLVGGFRMATNIPNIKHTLGTQGRLVTTGLLFDIGSDKIKNISYGVLKAIAEALNENPQLRIKIIGHTDSHGDENTNLALSKKRAESVKTYLVKYFKVNPSRLTTDGKGASMPIGTNDTPEGRANNRRVEFLKN